MQPEKAKPWDGALCALLWLLAALLTRPFVEAGMIDDFSYVKSAWVFADTHRLVYNGWATAMIGWQIAWGGLFAALFGHTYTAVRMANFVTSFATVWLAHAVSVRCGLKRRNAVIGTLALALCPLFLPMSVSFMTDISGLFSILACFYCCLRALDSQRDRTVLLWLAAATLLSIVGATARQIAWMSPLVMAPSAAWLLRRRKGVMPLAAVLWLVSAAAMLGSMRWFAHQPLSVPEGVIQGAIDSKTLRELAGNMTAALLCLLLMLLPLLAAWTRVRLTLPRLLTVLVVTPMLFGLFRFLTFHGIEKGLAPWTGDVLDKIGMLGYPNAWSLGIEPSPFSIASRVALSLIVLAVALWFALAVRRDDDNAWHPLLVLTVPFLLTYFALLAPRGMWGIVIDRYLLPPIFFGILALLRLWQHDGDLPRRSLALLALFALFSIAGTHDWIAMHRARVNAVARLQANGADRTGIAAGYELDGMVQIERTGAVLDPRVQYTVPMTQWKPEDLPQGCHDILNEHTPVIHPKLYLSASPQQASGTPGAGPCLVPSEITAEEYRAWLPPFRRRIYVLKRP